MGYSPWGRKESDTTERLLFTSSSLSAIRDSLGKNTSSGLPFPSPGDLPNPGIEPRSPALQTDSLPAEHTAYFVHENLQVGSSQWLRKVETANNDSKKWQSDPSHC